MPNTSSRLKTLASLPSYAMADWSGHRVYTRGQDYQSDGRVMDLAVTREGDLLAWVMGGERYATLVKLLDNDTLGSCCSCPYGYEGKHAVATLLEFQKRYRNKALVPMAEEDDPRWSELEEVIGEEECREDEFEDDELDEEEILSEDAPGETTVPESQLASQLQSLEKEELVNLILKFTAMYPTLTQSLSFLLGAGDNETERLIESVRGDLANLASCATSVDYWFEADDLADFSEIKHRLQLLLEKDHADEILEMGEELLATGNQIVETVDDDGVLAMELEECLLPLVEALRQCRLPESERFLAALHLAKEDDYQLLPKLEEYLLEEREAGVWDDVAEELLSQLQAEARGSVAWIELTPYKRDLISDWAIVALSHAGRTDEILPLCEREAQITGNYIRVVERLIDAGSLDSAEKWIWKGLRDGGGVRPVYHDRLVTRLRDIRKKQEDWAFVAALDAERFVHNPHSDSFFTCVDSASHAGAGDVVREALLAYLETGTLPTEQEQWPLSRTGWPAQELVSRHQFPLLNLLIRIAIEEKTPDRVLHWYEKLEREGVYHSENLLDDIAEAIRDHAPGRAVQIWKDLAEGLIAQVKPKLYIEAVRYLHKAAKTMKRVDKGEEFLVYLQDLRREHVRKKRLMEAMEGLECS
ncbi:hypothetical protein GF324_13315 [bacterium]|nr:hypothetical protein [bacterium]